MSRYETDRPSLFERCFAAVFSGAAAGATYTVWLLYHGGQWGAAQMASLRSIGVWVVLAGAALGFVFGISLVTRLWGGLWETNDEPSLSWRTVLMLLVLGAVVYAAFKRWG